MTNGITQTDTELTTFDVAALLGLGVPSLILSFILIIGFFKYKKLRESPGDIVFMISIGGLLLSVDWIISAIFSKPFDNDLSNNNVFCLSNAIISVSSGSLIYLYNIAFCIYLVSSLRNVLKASIITGKILHIVCIALTVAYTTFLGITGKLGKSVFGTCSIKANDSDPDSGVNLIEVIQYSCLILVYITVSLWSYIYIRARRPKLPETDKKARRAKVFLKHYLEIVVYNSVFWFLIEISYLIREIYYKEGDSQSKKTQIVQILTYLGNIPMFASLVVLLIMRLRDPLIARTMKKICLCRKKRLNSIKSDWNSEVQDYLSVEQRKNRINTYKLSLRNSPDALQEPIQEQLQEPLIEENKTIISSLNIHRTTDSQGINVIVNDLKIQTMVTIIAGVLFSYKKVFELGSNLDLQQIFRLSERLRQSKKFQITDSIVSGNWSRYSDRLPPPLDGVFSFHCPLLFKHIIKNDSGFVSIQESLGLESNHDAIKNSSGSGDGRSGEYFFFSSDNKLVIKTMKEKELEKFLEILPYYLQHLEQNPQSLITRIYGVFSFRREFEAESKHFLLMRNAAGVPSRYIARKYDVKGSTVGRRVLLEEFGDKTQITGSRTLKDLDFLKYELKLHIHEQFRIPLIAILDCDIEFLRSLNLIDYSLMIFILNRKLLLAELGDVPKSACYTQISSIEDETDPDWFYNLAIIDFLQEYNCWKWLENKFRRYTAAIFRCIWRLDISCQPPEQYAGRMKALMRKIIK